MAMDGEWKGEIVDRTADGGQDAKERGPGVGIWSHRTRHRNHLIQTQEWWNHHRRNGRQTQVDCRFTTDDEVDRCDRTSVVGGKRNRGA